jgi:hypothetical protein
VGIADIDNSIKAFKSRKKALKRVTLHRIKSFFKRPAAVVFTPCKGRRKKIKPF